MRGCLRSTLAWWPGSTENSAENEDDEKSGGEAPPGAGGAEGQRFDSVSACVSAYYQAIAARLAASCVARRYLLRHTRALWCCGGGIWPCTDLR